MIVTVRQANEIEPRSALDFELSTPTIATAR